MKTIRIAKILSIWLLVLNNLGAANAQGTMTFNDPWIDNGLAWGALAQFDGFSFRVNPAPPQSHDNIAVVGAIGPAGYPHNGTPYVAFVNTLGTPQYVIFAWTNAASLGDHSFTNGASFGLLSVDLADSVSPSLTPVDITFNGFKTDGSMVSQTFTAGGGGSSAFQTFQFNPDFASGLTRVEIPSAAWAVDNIVWVPEPSAVCLLLLGGGLLAYARFRRQD